MSVSGRLDTSITITRIRIWLQTTPSRRPIVRQPNLLDISAFGWNSVSHEDLGLFEIKDQMLRVSPSGGVASEERHRKSGYNICDKIVVEVGREQKSSRYHNCRHYNNRTQAESVAQEASTPHAKHIAQKRERADVLQKTRRLHIEGRVFFTFLGFTLFLSRLIRPVQNFSVNMIRAFKFF